MPQKGQIISYSSAFVRQIRQKLRVKTYVDLESHAHTNVEIYQTLIRFVKKKLKK